MAGQHRITEQILKKTLANKHEAHPKDIKLKDFTISEGSNKGDGYACEMKKVDVTSEIRNRTEDDTFMFKCVPLGEQVMYLMKEALIFRTEATFYMDIIPRVNKIAREHGIDEISTPKVYYGDEDEGVLAMQDLKAAGFGIKGKGVGLSLSDMKLFLCELAKIHSLSYHFIESYFGGAERFKKDYWYMNGEGWFSQESKGGVEVMEKIMKISFALGVMVIEETPEHKDLLEPLKAYVNDHFWKIKNDPHAPKGPFNCLLHNDAWCNNAMFRGSTDGDAKDVCLIDFQLVRRARPTADLAYCLVSSMTPEMRKAHMDELLGYYHKELLTILSKLGYSEDVYTYQQLKEDYVDSYPHGFSMGFQHILIQGSDPNAEDNLDFQKLLSDDSEEVMKKLNDYLRLQAKTNEKMRKQFLSLVLEAREMKVL